MGELQGGRKKINDAKIVHERKKTGDIITFLGYLLLLFCTPIGPLIDMFSSWSCRSRCDTQLMGAIKVLNNLIATAFQKKLVCMPLTSSLLLIY